MSSTLRWEPSVKTGCPLPDKLKLVLTRRFCDLNNVRLSESDIDYIRGLSDAEVPGASELLDALDKHGAIILKITH